jgi:hypothetical protein
VGELCHPELEQRDEMCGCSKRVRERRAGLEREGCDDGAADLCDEVRSLRRWTSFELGQVAERVFVMDAGDSQRDGLDRWVGGRPVLASEEGGSSPLFEIASAVPQHLFSESRMHYEPGAVGTPLAAPARARATAAWAGTVRRSRTRLWACRDIRILLRDCRSSAAGLRGAKPTCLQESGAAMVSSGSARVPAARQCPFGAVESARA